MTIIDKDTENSLRQSSYFAKQDIDAKSTAAYNSNPKFFNNKAHVKKVNDAFAITNEYLWGTEGPVYTTCRGKTSRRDIHTELKFCGALYDRNKKRADYEAQIQALDPSIEIVRKIATNSLSLHIF